MGKGKRKPRVNKVIRPKSRASVLSEKVGQLERQMQRETDRQTERQTDKQTDRQKLLKWLMNAIKSFKHI